jgi:hypothetical protein
MHYVPSFSGSMWLLLRRTLVRSVLYSAAENSQYNYQQKPRNNAGLLYCRPPPASPGGRCGCRLLLWCICIGSLWFIRSGYIVAGVGPCYQSRNNSQLRFPRSLPRSLARLLRSRADESTKYRLLCDSKKTIPQS